MTLILGIVCKDALILASDSQTSCDEVKRFDLPKIVAVDFGNSKIMVAQSGNVGITQRAIEIMREMSSEKTFSDYRLPAEIARDAMLKVKRETREQQCNCSMEELRNYIRNNDLQGELMLAYYFRGKPYIYKIDFDVGRCDKENSWYGVSGVGASLGSFLLKEHGTKDMPLNIGSIIAEYVVETASEHIRDCSPPAKVGVLVSDISEYGKSQSSVSTIHPTVIKKGMMIFYTAKVDQQWKKKVKRVFEVERKNRTRKFEKITEKSSLKGMQIAKEFFSPEKKYDKTIGKKMLKLFTGVSGLEIFDPA